MRHAIAALPLLAGCSVQTPGLRATISQDSVGVLTFHLVARDSVAPPEVQHLTVAHSRRGGRGTAASGSPAYWVIMRDPQSAIHQLPDYIRYGELPEGFVVARPAVHPPLPPGRYELDVKTDRGHSITYFKVGSDGRVR